jgi:hypothetical protein
VAEEIRLLSEAGGSAPLGWIVRTVCPTLQPRFKGDYRRAAEITRGAGHEKAVLNE